MNSVSTKRLYILAAVILATAAVCVLLWMIYAVPGYTERERSVRSENAVMKKDIADIEAMNGTTEAIDEKIKEAQAKIEEKYTKRRTTDETAASIIKDICKKAGVNKVDIDSGRQRMISPSGTYAPALYTAEVTVLFEGTEKEGANVIKGLEKSQNADFEVTAFIYSANASEEGEEESPETEVLPQAGKWIITAAIYYYI